MRSSESITDVHGNYDNNLQANLDEVKGSLKDFYKNKNISVLKSTGNIVDFVYIGNKTQN
jgi:hypothetical protein